MGGRKIELVREAVRKALAILRSDDRFSLVVYDDVIDVLVESTTASDEARRNVLARIAQVDARGSTNLGGGWLRGCEQIAAHLHPDSPGRCLLLTDGLANQGITDRDELSRHASELRARGVMTSTFGVGADFDEELLQAMAVAGGGHSYFVETPVQIPDLLTSELGEALETVAHDAAIEITLPAAVRAVCLNEFETTATSGGVRIELGSLVSRQDVSLVVMFEFPMGRAGEELQIGFGVRDRQSVIEAPGVRWTWTFAAHAANDSQPRDRVVDHAVATLYAARARREALKYNRLGEYDQARHALRSTAERILGYAGNDEFLNRLAHELIEERTAYSAPMTAMASKARYYSTQNVMRMRDQTGKAKRKQ
jgi:Ca-activated chloride channel family protein